MILFRHTMLPSLPLPLPAHVRIALKPLPDKVPDVESSASPPPTCSGQNAEALSRPCLRRLIIPLLVPTSLLSPSLPRTSRLILVPALLPPITGLRTSQQKTLVGSILPLGRPRCLTLSVVPRQIGSRTRRLRQNVATLNVPSFAPQLAIPIQIVPLLLYALTWLTPLPLNPNL